MPSKAAMRAAEIIVYGKHHIGTMFGMKTTEGIADLIDRETAAPELLQVSKTVLARLDLEPVKAVFPCSAMRDDLRAAIVKAEVPESSLLEAALDLSTGLHDEEIRGLQFSEKFDAFWAELTAAILREQSKVTK